MEKSVIVDKASAEKIYVDRFTLKPEESCDIEEQDDLFYFVLSGYGLMNVEKYGYNLEQETSVFVPGGTQHTFTNTGDVDFVLVRYATKA